VKNRRLVLWDIDGTLVTDGGASREAFDAALREVYDYSGDLDRYDFSGRTDPQIARMVLRDDGFDDAAVDARLGTLWAHYLDGVRRRIAGRVRALAGIPAILERLAATDQVLLALLTGNLEPGARLKLDPVDLNRYFAFGAFGSDSAHREQLPPIAVERASQRHGHRFSGRDVVILGDSIYDVRCGTPHGATTIAIASGKTAGATLRAENPDCYFDDASDTEALLAAILGSA
jgi:phosphoglycolate phosphatase-like HAD superfamily hydrolase